MAEYLRPWKLITFAAGVTLLIAGSYFYDAPDWDIPISLIMAGLAYLTAPVSMRIILERKWKQFPLMLFYTWFTVDGSYACATTRILLRSGRVETDLRAREPIRPRGLCVVARPDRAHGADPFGLRPAS